MLRPRILSPPAVSGNAPTNTAGGADCGQPEVFVALQFEPSKIDTVRSSRFPTKTVFVSKRTATARGAAPTGTMATGVQPDVVFRLQVAALIIDTVLSFVFVTYR